MVNRALVLIYERRSILEASPSYRSTIYINEERVNGLYWGSNQGQLLSDGRENGTIKVSHLNFRDLRHPEVCIRKIETKSLFRFETSKPVIPYN